ncbi:acyl-CoA thioesterase [Microbacterium sp. gxy059]|uniref:acyl-CoA thioesterase n=1 Tax=Microbacterium sp. gxy059 TaxID=2957199 RepID=UPI003D97DDE4
MLREILDLDDTGARTREDVFVGRSHPMPGGRVFGGQVAAQAVTAATRTVPDDRFPHSLHGYFLRPGDPDLPITFAVDRMHDGRSFSRRGVRAFQSGVPIFSSIVSYQDEDPGMEHQQGMPDVPRPEEIEAGDPGSPLLRANPIEARHVEGDIWQSVADARPRQAVWMRIRGPLDGDPALHRAVLAYMTDFTIQESVLRAHGISWRTPGLRTASLDHAIWWHRFAPADEWLLYVSESPSAQGGRGLSTGRLFTEKGVLVASVAQEIMARVPNDAEPAS